MVLFAQPWETQHSLHLLRVRRKHFYFLLHFFNDTVIEVKLLLCIPTEVRELFLELVYMILFLLQLDIELRALRVQLLECILLQELNIAL